jgi:hypothetical protein
VVHPRERVRMSKPSSPRPFSSTTKPIPRTLHPKCLKRQTTKHLLRHPLDLSPNPTNPTNNSNNTFFLLEALKGGIGQSPPKQSYTEPKENAATKCFQEP